jgi:hypothetical protein
MNYKNKYVKYKNKYLELLKQLKTIDAYNGVNKIGGSRENIEQNYALIREQLSIILEKNEKGHILEIDKIYDALDNILIEIKKHDYALTDDDLHKYIKIIDDVYVIIHDSYPQIIKKDVNNELNIMNHHMVKSFVDYKKQQILDIQSDNIKHIFQLNKELMDDTENNKKLKNIIQTKGRGEIGKRLRLLKHQVEKKYGYTIPHAMRMILDPNLKTYAILLDKVFELFPILYYVGRDTESINRHNTYLILSHIREHTKQEVISNFIVTVSNPNNNLFYVLKSLIASEFMFDYNGPQVPFIKDERWRWGLENVYTGIYNPRAINAANKDALDETTKYRKDIAKDNKNWTINTDYDSGIRVIIFNDKVEEIKKMKPVLKNDLDDYISRSIEIDLESYKIYGKNKKGEFLTRNKIYELNRIYTWSIDYKNTEDEYVSNLKCDMFVLTMIVRAIQIEMDIILYGLLKETYEKKLFTQARILEIYDVLRKENKRLENELLFSYKAGGEKYTEKNRDIVGQLQYYYPYKLFLKHFFKNIFGLEKDIWELQKLGKLTINYIFDEGLLIAYVRERNNVGFMSSPKLPNEGHADYIKIKGVIDKMEHISSFAREIIKSHLDNEPKAKLNNYIDNIVNEYKDKINLDDFDINRILFIARRVIPEVETLGLANDQVINPSYSKRNIKPVQHDNYNISCTTSEIITENPQIIIDIAQQIHNLINKDELVISAYGSRFEQEMEHLSHCAKSSNTSPLLMEFKLMDIYDNKVWKPEVNSILTFNNLKRTLLYINKIKKWNFLNIIQLRMKMIIIKIILTCLIQILFTE